MDRRAAFFAIAAAVCGLLALVAPGEYRQVCEIFAGVYVVLAVLSALDAFSRSRR